MKNYLGLQVDEQIELIQPTLEMAEAEFSLIDSDRGHIGKYLDWVENTKTAEDTKEFIQLKLSGYVAGTDRLFFIAKDSELIGTIDFHSMDLKNQKAEIGYWLHSSHCGQGITTKCVRKLCEMGFEEMNLNKISILVDVDNVASMQIADHCGFSFVGVERAEVKLYGEFRDMNKYSLLKSEYESMSKAQGNF